MSLSLHLSESASIWDSKETSLQSLLLSQETSLTESELIPRPATVGKSLIWQMRVYRFVSRHAASTQVHSNLRDKGAGHLRSVLPRVPVPPGIQTKGFVEQLSSKTGFSLSPNPGSEISPTALAPLSEDSSL